MKDTIREQRKESGLINKPAYHEKIFNKMLELIKPVISEISYKENFRIMKPVGIEQDSTTGKFSFIIQVPTQNIKKVIIIKYNEFITETINKIDATITNVKFIVNNPWFDPHFKLTTKLAVENFIVSNPELAQDFKLAIKLSVEAQIISETYLQRKLQINYSKMAEIIAKMEEFKFITSKNDLKLRDVYIDKKIYEEIFNESYYFKNIIKW